MFSNSTIVWFLTNAFEHSKILMQLGKQVCKPQ
ncbi:hypothetical protein MALU111345_17090 [Marinicrinis lubricantis]